MADGNKKERPVSDLDTGTPGFDIDGTAYTYDVGPDDSSREQVTAPADHGNIHVDDTQKDISKGTRDTLANYLSELTAKNRFPVAGGGSSIMKLTADNGLPASLPNRANEENQYVARTKLDQPTYGPATTLKDFLVKGKQQPYPLPAGVSDGNSLLPGVVEIPPSDFSSPGTPVQEEYVPTVLRRNRFSRAATAANVDVRTPGKGYNPVFHHPRYGDVTANRLANVGPILSIRASQELLAAERLIDPAGGTVELGAILPGGVQLGATKVDSFILEAKDIFDGGLTDEEVSIDSMVSLGDQSWGSLNNVLDQYSGITAFGMPLLSVALTAATVLVFELFGMVISTIAGEGEPEKKKDDNGRYYLGRSTVVEMPDPDAFPPIPLDFGALLGIRKTIYPFGDCLKEGTAAFFGIDLSNPLAAISSTLLESIESPGFNVGIARTIIRSGLLIVEAFKKAFSSPNFIAGIKNVLSIVDTLRTSKFIAAMNVFSRLGDQILSTDALADQVATSDDASRKTFTTIDALDDGVPGSTVMKNRLNFKTPGGGLKLAWSSNRAPSLYLMPTSIVNMAAVTRLGAFFPGHSIQEEASRSMYVSADTSMTRIPAEHVATLEQSLSAEYVPFYFHDLRTNEIISFHAFLASLSDDYTPAWESIEGIGRVENVKIYKNTQRKISMSFHVIATSEADFNDMWVKLNKLVTLVYPQYTRGRNRESSDGKYKYVQPFSQIPAVSPVIRIRLGDLLRSNYSRFALTRLFGIGTEPGVTLDGQKINVDTSTSAMQDLIKDALVADKLGVVATGTNYRAYKGPFSITALVGIGSGGTAPRLVTEDISRSYLALDVIQYNDDKTKAVVQPRYPKVDELLAEGYSAEQCGKIMGYVTKTYSSLNKTYNVIGGLYEVPYTDLVPMKLSMKKLSDKLVSTMQPSVDKIDAFMSSKDNALAKSFKSVQGKGLAGVIESMNFNWYDNVTWETKPYMTAPKRCVVTLAFSPIHDIAPGIDHLGYNRSPVYSVGWQGQHSDDSEDKNGE